MNPYHFLKIHHNRCTLVYTYTGCKGGGYGVKGGEWGLTDKTPATKSFYRSIFLDNDIAITSISLLFLCVRVYTTVNYTQTSLPLKVGTNEKQGGQGSWTMIDIGPDCGDRCPFLFLLGRHLGLILSVRHRL